MDYIYDIETYPNIFTMAVSQPDTSSRWLFEISEWRDDSTQLLEFLRMLYSTGARLVGFNNVNFDYPVIHVLMSKGQATAHDLWLKANEIITSNDNFAHRIREPFVPQVDLFLIHHFDNKARRTSLKALEFAMRLKSIRDLPFEPNTVLSYDQSRILIEYNWVDIDATEEFYSESTEQIEFRRELTATHGKDFTNFNDTKIGKQVFIMQLEDASPGICFSEDRKPRQTLRPIINIADVIFPYVRFQHPELTRVLNHLKTISIQDGDDRGLFKDVSATIDGFQMDFGRGGIHGSVNDTTLVSDLEYVVLDLDVTSYYPSLAIVNRLYPEHLGELFCDIYTDLKAERVMHPKGSAPNKMLKLALNGVYGETGNHYSPFYDMKYLLSITINGQLLLCMLAEYLMQIPDLTMIQMNTDGLTARVRRDRLDAVKVVTDWWQEYTCLELEDAEYSRMFVRDVNNYVAEYAHDGSLKRKGAYEVKAPGERNPTGWHQDVGGLVIPKAAEAFLVRGVPIRDFIHQHDDVFDFALRGKATGGAYIEIDGVKQQRITRYLITHSGGPVMKVSPPAAGYKIGQWKRANSLSDSFYRSVVKELDDKVQKQAEAGLIHEIEPLLDSVGLPWDERINTKNKSKYEIRRTGINVGWNATECNDLSNTMYFDINHDFYIQEAEKLVGMALWR